MMQLLKKRHLKILSIPEKLSQWQQELDLDISKNHFHFKESLLYFVLKSWLYKNNTSPLPDIIMPNTSFNIDPEDDFIIVNKTTWYSIKGKLRGKFNPVKKLGYFCNKKLVIIFDNFCYFFYKDKLSKGKISEGYINFMSKYNTDKIIFLLESSEINFFFTKIKANLLLYKQILCYKGNTFELILKNNAESNSNNNIKPKLINSKSSIYQNINGKINLSPIRNKYSENKLLQYNNKSLLSSYNNSCIINERKLNKLNNTKSSNNIFLFQGDISTINKSLSREKSYLNLHSINIKHKSDKNLLQVHFPSRKLSKIEDNNLNKILKAVLCYYYFNKIFLSRLNIEQELNDLYLYMINKDWMKYFINKFNFEKIKNFLDNNYDSINYLKYTEYKEQLINNCDIKDFLLVKKEPIKPLEKDYTEFGQEYCNNYELIHKEVYDSFKEAFGSYELDEIKEYKVNIIKKKGIIINYNPNQIEITKQYMTNINNNLNTKPERYLIVLTNNKYMNFRIKRPLEENGIEEGIKLIPTEQHEEDDEEYFRIIINKKNIGTLINITNPINKELGNFIPSTPCLTGLEQNDIIYSMNSVIQCLNNIPSLIGYFLNKKRMKQISSRKETRQFSCQILDIFKNLWLNDSNEKKFSAKNISNYLLEMNPFLSGNESNAKELLYYMINLIHQELNKIENSSQYLSDDKKKFNYQLTFEKFYNFFKSNYKSIISDIFYGFKNDTITCTKCSNTSHSINFYDIFIFPPNDIRIFKSYSKDTILIEECFEYNERKIELYNCRNYLCNFCNHYANGILVTKLVSIPKVLIISFERKEEKDFNIKINFNEFINLRNFAFSDTNNSEYELIGVIANLNKFNEDKKYVAFCKSYANKMWYLYDDLNISNVEFDNVKNTGIIDILIYNIS